MDEDLKLLIIFVLRMFILALILALLATLVNFSIYNIQQYNACQELENVSELEHHFDIWNGCIVKYNNYWFKPSDFPFQEIDLNK